MGRHVLLPSVWMTGSLSGYFSFTGPDFDIVWKFKDGLVKRINVESSSVGPSRGSVSIVPDCV